ncbi:MAG: hypothetical protein JW892_14265 [Anaerolineae bacterium]|nr:hypothetical protein [Anaerolineae bacterium]
MNIPLLQVRSRREDARATGYSAVLPDLNKNADAALLDGEFVALTKPRRL